MEPRGESIDEHQKLLPSEFQSQTARYLEGTVLLQLFNSINLATNKDGYLETYVIENVRTMLNVASEQTPDEMARMKFDNFRAWLAQF